MRPIMFACLLAVLVGCGGKEPPPPTTPFDVQVSWTDDNRRGEELAPGDLIVLEGTANRPARLKWTCDDCCRCLILPTVDGRSRIVLSPTAVGVHAVKLTGDIVVDGVPIEIVRTHRIRVVDGKPEPQPGPGPKPEPQPGPQPSPSPDLPDGRFGFAPWCQSQTLALVPASPNRAAQAHALGGAFRSVASQIAAGALSDTMAIQERTLQGIEQALGDTQPTWSAFLDALFARTRTKLTHGSPAADVAVCWTEIAQGLEAVR